jgi:hypothetical protein
MSARQAGVRIDTHVLAGHGYDRRMSADIDFILIVVVVAVFAAIVGVSVYRTRK